MMTNGRVNKTLPLFYPIIIRYRLANDIEKRADTDDHPQNYALNHRSYTDRLNGLFRER